MTSQVISKKMIVRRSGTNVLTFNLVGFLNGFISIGRLLGELLLRGVTRMADPAAADSNSGTGDDSGVGPGREYPGTPRWVKVFGIIVIVLVLLVVIIIFIGGHTSPVQHGP